MKLDEIRENLPKDVKLLVVDSRRGTCSITTARNADIYGRYLVLNDNPAVMPDGTRMVAVVVPEVVA